jgi:hypothetical protein
MQALTHVFPYVLFFGTWYLIIGAITASWLRRLYGSTSGYVSPQLGTLHWVVLIVVVILIIVLWPWVWWLEKYGKAARS